MSKWVVPGSKVDLTVKSFYADSQKSGNKRLKRNCEVMRHKVVEKVLHKVKKSLLDDGHLPLVPTGLIKVLKWCRHVATVP